MPTYRYVAQDKEGKMIASTITALNMNLAIDTLTASRVKVIEISPVAFSMQNWLKAYQKVQRESVVMMTRRLATMLAAGVHMLRGLQVLYDQEEDVQLKPILMSVLHDINTGSTLSWAMSKHPKVFDSVFVSMIKIGDTTGQMADMLAKLADFLERDLRIKKQAQSAMTYPMFIFGVCCIVIAVIFFYILPQLLDIFTSLGPNVKLPLPTVILMFICNSIRNPYFQLASIIGIVYYFVYFRDYLKTPEGKFNFDRIKMTAPLIGNLNKKMLVAQFCRCMGILLLTGVPLVKSLEVLTEFLDNEYFKRISCVRLIKGVKEGENISQAITAVGFFPPMTCSMLAVGESTGELPTMLCKISEFYDQEVQYALEQFLVLLEPLMIGIMGLIVCFILLSIFMPLYSMIMQMG